MSVRPVQDQLNWIGNRLIRQAYKLRHKKDSLLIPDSCLIPTKGGAGGSVIYKQRVHASVSVRRNKEYIAGIASGSPAKGLARDLGWETGAD